MKRLLFPFCLALMLLPGNSKARIGGGPLIFGSGPFIGDLSCNLQFSAISNSPAPSNSFSGYAGYYNKDICLSGKDSATNDVLYVNIQSPGVAVDGWILRQEDDGSFTPITELTNQNFILFNFSQFIILTTNQVLDLISNRLYAELDFADSNYLANITPDFSKANDPALPIFIPAEYFYFDRSGTVYVIAPNNQTAKVVFNGSGAFSRFYLPLEFVWGWSDTLSNYATFATTAKATNNFTLGQHFISVSVTDGIATNGEGVFQLQIITPGTAVNGLKMAIQQSKFNAVQKNQLTGSLSVAAMAFNRGNMSLGVQALHAFQGNLLSLKLPTTDSLFFARASQAIIDTVE